MMKELHDLGIQGCGALFLFQAEVIAYFNEKKVGLYHNKSLMKQFTIDTIVIHYVKIFNILVRAIPAKLF